MFGDPLKLKTGKNVFKGKDFFSLASGQANTTANLNDNFEFNCYGGNGITGKSEKYLIKDPTIVIGRVGEYCGSVYLTTPCSWITDNAMYITSYDQEKINLDFFCRECQILDFHRFSTTVGQPKITQKPILECLYIIPGMDKQNQFNTLAQQIDKSKLFE